MNELDTVVDWMLIRLNQDTCLYQDDVVDYLIKANLEHLTAENAEGNQVLRDKVLSVFKQKTLDDVVWVQRGLYWRFRVLEDEPSRMARW